jgi:hypothetical protein
VNLPGYLPALPTCALEQVAFTDIAGAMWNMKAKGTVLRQKFSPRGNSTQNHYLCAINCARHKIKKIM